MYKFSVSNRDLNHNKAKYAGEIKHKKGPGIDQDHIQVACAHAKHV